MLDNTASMSYNVQIQHKSCITSLSEKMQTSDDFYIFAETMRRYGGGFCRKLADAFCAADASNKQKIIAAFPELVENYGPGSRFAKAMQQEQVNV